MWIDNDIYFISDHEGIVNIYKTTKSAKNIEKVTNHRNYYVRNCNTDGQSIVYHSGADIYVYSIVNKTITNVKIDFNSSKIQTSRKYVNASNYLESYTLSNDKKFLNIVSRGKSFTFGSWNGSIHQHGIKDGVRYKHSQFCNDNKNLFIVSDRNNTENIELHSLSSSSI